MDLEDAVVAAWHATADELPGVRAILDRDRAEPRTRAIAEAMAKATAKEHILLAMMAGRVSARDAAAARVGAEIEDRARATYRPVAPRRGHQASSTGSGGSRLSRLTDSPGADAPPSRSSHRASQRRPGAVPCPPRWP